MIDIHCHVLYDADDGPDSLELSLPGLSMLEVPKFAEPAEFKSERRLWRLL